MYVFFCMNRLTPGKSWVLGFLAGDGHVQEDGVWGAGFNTDKELVDELVRVLVEEWGASPAVTHKDRDGRKRIWTIRFRRPVASDLLRFSPSWKTMEWRVPRQVMDAGGSTRAAYVRGFFDAEGSAYGSPKWRVAAASANKVALQAVLQIIEGLGIEGKFYSYKRKGGELDTHVLSVHKRSEVIRFAELVGFHSSTKQSRLRGVKEAQYGRESKWEGLLPEIHRMRSEGMNYYEIESELGLYPRESMAAVAWERRGLGIKTRRDSLGPLADQVLPLLGLGLSHREVAVELGVKPNRVSACVQWDRKSATSRQHPREAGTRHASRKLERLALSMLRLRSWPRRLAVQSSKSGMHGNGPLATTDHTGPEFAWQTILTRSGGG